MVTWAIALEESLIMKMGMVALMGLEEQETSEDTLRVLLMVESPKQRIANENGKLREVKEKCIRAKTISCEDNRGACRWERHRQPGCQGWVTGRGM